MGVQRYGLLLFPSSRLGLVDNLFNGFIYSSFLGGGHGRRVIFFAGSAWFRILYVSINLLSCCSLVKFNCYYYFLRFYSYSCIVIFLVRFYCFNDGVVCFLTLIVYRSIFTHTSLYCIRYFCSLIMCCHRMFYISSLFSWFRLSAFFFFFINMLLSVLLSFFSFSFFRFWVL